MCCKDSGIWSTRHTLLLSANKHIPDYTFPSSFEILEPSNSVQNNTPIADYLPTVPGTAPKGFVIPPPMAIFSHAAYHFSRHLLAKVCLAIWLIAPHVLANDFVDTIHECRLGHTKVFFL